MEASIEVDPLPWKLVQLTSVEICMEVTYRADPRNKYTWPDWGQKQVHSKIKSKAHPTSPAIGPKLFLTG